MTIAAFSWADWNERAACIGQDTNRWFGKPHETQPALVTCATCPVRAECLHDALRHETAGSPRYGIRGGLNGRERNRIPELPNSTVDAIATLRDLLADLDEQHHSSAERTPEPMTTAPNPQPTPPAVDVQLKAADDDPENLPVGKLLAWGDQHLDAEVQDQAARARVALAGLRQRYTADRELTAISSEREQLEKRLAELQAREQELAPAKPKKARKPVNYPAAEVRAWAKENGFDCPPVGRVPNAVVDAWRQATSTPA